MGFEIEVGDVTDADKLKIYSSDLYKITYINGDIRLKFGEIVITSDVVKVERPILKYETIFSKGGGK